METDRGMKGHECPECGVMTEAHNLCRGCRNEAIRAALRAGQPASGVATEFKVDERTVYRVSDGSFPQQSRDLVLWRHAFIWQMKRAGLGPSYIGAVLRLDHSSVIHHLRGDCRCEAVHKTVARTA